jgi:two-component system, chemotaxis family, protein-glutamate methylesterase/glutaminase
VSAAADQNGNAAEPPRYRVMVVDDSSVIRGMLTRVIEENPALQVVSSVSDGQAAINALQRLPVDVIVLDIEMPIMDGLTAIPKLLEVDRAVQIIIASTLSMKNADVSLRALNLGAADYIPKPAAREISAALSFKDDLNHKIMAHAAVARKAGVRLEKGDKSIAVARLSRDVPAAVKPDLGGTKSAGSKAGALSLRPMPTHKPALIAIGSSTGGPQALFAVIKAMGVLEQPVIITQHMPPQFTTVLAEHITKQCAVTCAEATEGMELKAGHYYLAPGDYHLILRHRVGRTVLTLGQTAHENFCRPAVDPMLRAAIAVYGAHILTVILTGMGQDGLKGSEMVVTAGGAVLAQDEASSVVWGMPAAVAKAGLCSAILPLNDIGAYVRRIALGGTV